jgi:threonine 3-dehydrogenase
MRALVKQDAAPGTRLVSIPVPVPGPGQVLVRVEAAGVCESDVGIDRWDAWASTNVRPPLVLGHEMAGTVVALGEGVSRVRVGQLVAAESNLVDWSCYQCRTGREYACRNLRILGVHEPGVFAEYAVLPETNAWVTVGLSPEVAVLQEPMGTAVFATFVEEIAGESVAVLGCGPIGLMCVAVAKRAGARRVFAVDGSPVRLGRAAAMGADVLLGVGVESRAASTDHVLGETGGDGVDVVIETAGSGTLLQFGLRVLANGGRVSLLGTHAGPVALDLSRSVISKGIRIYGITGRRQFESWYRTRALLEEGLDLSSIVTHRLPLSRFADAFDLVETGEAGRVLLLPQEG